MAELFSFKMPLNEWRHYLQDINFWLNGYLDSDAYRSLEAKLDFGSWWFVSWNVGVGPACCFTRAISSIVRDVRTRRYGPFDHVIDVDMKEAAAVLPAGRSPSINDKVAIKVADQLGLLDQEYRRLKAEGDERWYYTYGLKGARYSAEGVRSSIVPQINQNLAGKKYMLVVENLDEPIKPIKIEAFTEDLLCLPPPVWKNSFWLVSATSRDVYERSKPDYPCLIKISGGDDIVILTLYSLHQAAKYILGATGSKDERYWHHVVVRCFYYATVLLSPHCSSAHGDGDQQGPNVSADITSDELIRQWAAQGLIAGVLERTGEVTTTDCQGKYNDIYQVGNVILEAFRDYSLLQLPFSPTTKADEATKSAAHFLAYHNLIQECHMIEELFEGNHPGLERVQWISHVGDQGWHISRDWLSQGASGPTTLIIRNCSQQSMLFMKLQSDHFLAKLSFLRVLDLSYTPLESLPCSICYLQKLQLLSLRGCYNLRSPFCFPDTEITLCENNNNKKLSLLYYLDLSYSNINKFQDNFFHNMPNLKELLLVKCSNLEEMPPSIALSSLLTLEVTGTQIKCFHREMFGEMKKLKSLKLIENRKLLFVPGLVSKLCGLINLHIEGCKSMTEVEITLERHPTLRSFIFIGAPRMRRLSLRGCKMLEHVDIKEVDALEELDLSATAIKELPEDIPNLPQLRQLLLKGVPFLRRFPWHKLQRLPDVFCLDQCSDGIVNHSNPQAAQVCISDSRLFDSFNNYDTVNLVRIGRFLKSFHIQVASCKVANRKIHDEEDMVKTNKFQVAQTTYADVNRHYLTDGVSMMSMDDVPPFQETERHVEISAVEQYPSGLNCLLAVTKSICMSHDNHVSSLTSLSYDLDELEECKLQWCHQMVDIFYSMDVKALKNAYVSHLKSLTHFFGHGYANFTALKHLHLEHCPRLKGIFSLHYDLASLVTLDILFCYNLKAIFYDDNYGPSSYHKLPHLRRIRLQELPLLEHFHVYDAILTAPAWEELLVRGCWSLRHLPRLDQQPDKAVKVSGERAWWTKLRWDSAPSHRRSYEARLPPASASIRERVIIRTYLR